jgi:hypothetical protein
VSKPAWWFNKLHILDSSTTATFYSTAMVIGSGMLAFKFQKRMLIKDMSYFQSGIKEVVIKTPTLTFQQVKLPKVWHVELRLSVLILAVKVLVKRGT